MGNFNGNVSGEAVEKAVDSTSKLTQKKNDFDVKNYLDTKLGKDEKERTITVRILPVSCEDGNFRIAVKTHNLKVSRRVAISGFKSFLCLDEPQVPNYDPAIRCPICEKAEYYFSEAKKCRETDKEKSKKLFMKACSLKSKTTYIVRVIERGKEDEGVKFWRFNENTQGKGIYDALIALYKQRKQDMVEAGIENYNIFDLDNGHDIVLRLTRTVRSDGQEGVSIQITDNIVNKPLTNDINKGNEWINDTKRWYNAYTVKSTEYLKIIADDMIPYYDRAKEEFVPKTEEDFLEAEMRKKEQSKRENEAIEAASEVLNEHVDAQMPQMGVINDDDDDMDLPF